MIKDLEAGQNLVAFFVLRKKAIRTKFGSEEIYLSLELGDASGRVRGSVWDEPKQVYDALTPGDILKVKAKAIHLKGRVHLNIEKVRKAEERDEPEIDMQELVLVVDKDREKLWKHLEDLITSVENTYLKRLLSLIFEDEKIKESFRNAPGGKLWHHNYLGGLLEHTLSVTEIADQTGKLYPEAKRDLLVTAGLLHDIGKIDSYTYKTLIDFTDQGRLLGHIVIGSQLVSDKIKQIDGFPSELRMELLHLILSHQGKLEQASPVVPMTLEAIILYYADELDSTANAFQRIGKKEGKSGQSWSSYVNLINRYIYFGKEKQKGKHP